MNAALKQKRATGRSWQKGRHSRRSKHHLHARTNPKLSPAAAISLEAEDNDYYRVEFNLPEEFINFRTQDMGDLGQSSPIAGEGRENNWDVPVESPLERDTPLDDSSNLIS